MANSSKVIAEEPAVDLAIARTMAEELEAYIFSDELYRTVIADTPRGQERLQMTGGDLLTRLHRLHATRDELNETQQYELDQVQQQVKEGIYSLRTRFHQRLQREIKTRLDSLKWFLDDCRGKDASCRSEYPFEIRNRQRIEEALKELGDDLPDDLRQQISGIDRRIRGVAQASDFVWSDALQAVFPREPYWYLYMLPSR